MLQKRPDENKYEHHRRLVFGKLVDGTLSDIDYTELSTHVYGKEYSSDVARRMMYGSCRTLQLLDENSIKVVDSDSMVKEINNKRIELQKERQRFYDQRVAFNKIIRERSRQEELNDILVRTITEAELPSLEYKPAEIELSDNDLLVSLNDIHYGAFVDNHWQKYDSKVCASMFRIYLDRIIQIGRLHQSENCIVCANGDMISGNIHYQIAVSNKENIIEQLVGVSELIAGFLAELSKHFKEVHFLSVAGNHSRIDTKERAVPQERLDDLVTWYLAARMAKHENVIIDSGEKIDCTMYVLNLRGKNYVGVHGDYDASPVKVQALQAMVGRDVYAILTGHLHHNMRNTVQGIHILMAGSFLGMDDHCVTKRIVGKPEQMVCVCDANGIRCSYDIVLM